MLTCFLRTFLIRITRNWFFSTLLEIDFHILLFATMLRTLQAYFLLLHGSVFCLQFQHPLAVGVYLVGHCHQSPLTHHPELLVTPDSPRQLLRLSPYCLYLDLQRTQVFMLGKEAHQSQRQHVILDLIFLIVSRKQKKRPLKCLTPVLAAI